MLSRRRIRTGTRRENRTAERRRALFRSAFYRRLLAEKLEDRRVLAGVDYGDAIDLETGNSAGDYSTLAADRGAAHEIVPGLYLGRSVDADDGNLHSADALADDHSIVLADLRGDYVAAIDPEKTAAGTPGTVPALGGGTWEYFSSATINPTDASADLDPFVWDTGMNAFEGQQFPNHTDGFNGNYVGFPSGTELTVHPYGQYGRKTVSRWTAADGDEGLVDITGNVRKSSTTPSDGVRFQIYVDGKLAYEYVLTGDDGRGSYFELRDVDVQRGTTVDFVVDQNGRSDYDSTRVGATITRGDDEDGLTSPASDIDVMPGTTPMLTVRATNETSEEALIAGWIDYNQDGQFDNASERATVTVPAGTRDGEFALVFPEVPAWSAFTTYARLRISNDAGFVSDPQSTGLVVGGEVEDYRLGRPTRIWDGDAGDGDVFNAANWALRFATGEIVNSNSVPSSYENVVIGPEMSGKTLEIKTASNDRFVVNAVQSHALLHVGDRTQVSINGNSRVAGVIVDGERGIYGNVLTAPSSGSRTLFVENDLVWARNDISSLRVEVLGGLQMIGDDSRGLARGRIDAYGDSVWSGGGIQISGSTLANHGTMTVTSNADVLRPATFSPTGSLVNASSGTWIHDAPYDENDLADHYARFYNNGRYQVRSGRVQTGDCCTTYTVSGSFEVGSGAEYKAGGPITYNDQSSFVGAPGSTLIVDGLRSFQGSAALEGTLVVEGTSTFDVPVNVSHLRLDGTLVARGGFSVLDRFDWDAGGIQGTVTSEGMTRIGSAEGGSQHSITFGRLVNQGTAVWTGQSLSFHDGTLQNEGTFLDQSDGVLVRSIFTNGTIDNRGQWTVDDQVGSSDPATRNVSFINSGLFDVGGGRIDVYRFTQDSGTLTLRDGALTSSQLNVLGGSIGGSGQIDATTIALQGGTLSPGGGGGIGVLDLRGNLTGSGTAVRIDIAGAPTDGQGGDAAGTNFDRLVIDDATTVSQLDGGLVAGYLPKLGDSYRVIESVAPPILASTGNLADLGFDARVDGNDVRIDVVSEIEFEPIGVAQSFNDGVAALRTAIADWGSRFDLQGVDLPVTVEHFASLFGLGGTLGLVRQSVDQSLKTINTSVASLDEVANQIDAIEGLTVECRTGDGVCDPTEGIRIRFDRTVEDLTSAAGYDDATSALLTQLAAAADLDGTLDYQADLVIGFVFGVDTSGFFVDGDSGITLQLTAAGGLSGDYDLSSYFSASIGSASSAVADYGIAMRIGNEDQQLRLPDLDNLQDPDPRVNGAATVSLGQTLQPIDIEWSAEWTMTVTDGTTSTASDVRFPTRDEFIDASLPYFSQQLSDTFGSGIGDAFATIDLPLIDEAGFPTDVPGGNRSGTGARSFDFLSALNPFAGWFSSNADADDSGRLFVSGLGLTATEGIEQLKIDALREFDDLDLDGTDIRVGVISDGVIGLAQASSGLLPEITPGSVNVFADYPGGPTERSQTGSGAEGTAILEILQDIAPGAKYYFVGVGDIVGTDSQGRPTLQKVNGEEAFIAGLRWFAEQGVQIVVDDIGFFGAPFFHDGVHRPGDLSGDVAAEVIDLLATTEMVFVSSAGNQNQTHYQSNLRVIQNPDGLIGTYHEFQPREYSNRHQISIEIPKGESVFWELQWLDAPTTSTQLELKLFDQSGQLLKFTSGPKPGDPVTTRTLSYRNATDRSQDIEITIEVVSHDPDSLPQLEMFVLADFEIDLKELSTPFDSVFGHPAVPGVVSVGAYNKQNSNAFYPAAYSSVGPSTTSNLLEIRRPLDVIATDAVSISGVGGFGDRSRAGDDPAVTFSGTSAASPHVAGILTLLKQAFPNATREQLIDALRGTARDVTSPPIAVEETRIAEFGEQTLLFPLENDIDVDALLQAVGSRDELKIVSARIEDGLAGDQVEVSDDRSFLRFTPAPQIADERSVDVVYTIADSEGNLATASVIILLGDLDQVSHSDSDQLVIDRTEPITFEPIEFDYRLIATPEGRVPESIEGAIVNVSVVSANREYKETIQSMLRVSEDGQFITFSPDERLDGLVATGNRLSGFDYRVREHADFVRLAEVVYTVQIDGEQTNYNGNFELIVSRDSGLRPATSEVIRDSDSILIPSAAGYDDRTGYGVPDAAKAAEYLDSLLASDAPPAIGVSGGPQSAPIAAPLFGRSFTYDEMLQQLGVSITTDVDTGTINDLLTGQGVSGTLFEIAFQTDASDETFYRGEYAVDLQDFAGIESAFTSGRVDYQLRPIWDLGFGVDATGFYVDATGSVDAEIVGRAEATGAFAGLDGRLSGYVSAEPTLLLDALDADNDGLIRPVEAAANLSDLSPEIGPIDSQFEVQLSSELLDYVDADNDISNNTIHDGDVFTFTAATELTASVPDGGGGIDFQWSGIELKNGSGDDPFTSSVLAENLRELARAVIRGERTVLNQELLGAFGLQQLPLTQSFETPSSLADGLQFASALAESVLDNTQIVCVIPFNDEDPSSCGDNSGDPGANDSIEDWLNQGMPADVQEIVRLRVDLGQIGLAVADELRFDLSTIFPGQPNFSGRAAIRNAELFGELTFGFDTTSNPFYLLTTPDAISPNLATSLGGRFDLSVDVSSESLGGGILDLENA